MRKFLLQIGIVILVILPLTGFSQDFFVESKVSNSTPAVNEKFKLTYILKFKGNSFSATNPDVKVKKPDLSAFTIQNQGGDMGMSFNFGMGMDDGISVYNYSFILIPKKKGNFEIEPFVYIWNGKQYKSETVKITVNTEKEKSTTNSSQTLTEAEVKSRVDKNIFIKANISKTNPYKGEQVILEYKLYRNMSLYQASYKDFPKYPGLLTEDIDISKETPKQETLDGKNYYVTTIKKMVITPRQEGKQTIEPMAITGVVLFKSKQKRKVRNFFGEIIEIDDYVNQEYDAEIVSNKIVLNVKPLPSPIPEKFSGLVGDFDITAAIDKSTTKTNDPITYRIVAKGNGNLKLLSEFNLDIPSDIEVYEPKINDNIKVTGSGISGDKTFEYLLIPRIAGKYTIPSLPFSYFNAKQGKFVDADLPEFNIIVEKGDGKEEAFINSGVSKKEIELRGKDIYYIWTKHGKFYKSDNIFFGTALFYILIAIPILGFILFIIIVKRNIVKNSDIVKVRNKKANAKAKKHLKKAKALLKQNNKSEFYPAITNALVGYVADKLNIPASDIIKENVSEKLASKNISIEDIKELLNIWEDCDFAKYVNSSTGTNMEKIYQNSFDLITKLEKEL